MTSTSIRLLHPELRTRSPRGGYRCRVAATDRVDDAKDRDSRDPDAELAAAWAEDGHRVMRQVWDRYGTLVQTYCSRAIADRDLAADCVQETFVSAWRSRHRFDPTRGNLAAWLLGIARHRVHDTYRARARARRIDDAAVPAAAVVEDPDEALVRRLLVADALRHLGDRPRQVLSLAFYDGLSQTDIAARLGLPLGTVKSDMRRALLRLRTVLGEDDDVRA